MDTHWECAVHFVNGSCSYNEHDVSRKRGRKKGWLQKSTPSHWVPFTSIPWERTSLYTPFLRNSRGILLLGLDVGFQDSWQRLRTWSFCGLRCIFPIFGCQTLLFSCGASFHEREIDTKWVLQSWLSPQVPPTPRCLSILFSWMFLDLSVLVICQRGIIKLLDPARLLFHIT